MKKNLSSLLCTRVTVETRNAFIKKAKKFGDPSQIHRELLQAFIEDRLTIEAPLNPLYEEK